MQYHEFVDYSKLDPFKRHAMKKFGDTLSASERLNIQIVPETMGEPAVAFDFLDQDFMLAFNVEGLGTKNMIADAMSPDPRGKGVQYYETIGQDTVAMSTNDLLAIGADAFAYGDIISSGDSSWFENDDKTAALLEGYRKAALELKMTIPCGETPTLAGIVNPNTLDMAGASMGIIKPKDQIVLGSTIAEGDIIFGLESSGVHSNGISLIRKVVEGLPDGYFTELPSGNIVGEELLKPTLLYTRPIIETMKKARIHYLAPITGHGWKKIMRSKKPFTYEITHTPEKSEIFSFIQEQTGIDDREAYYTWNMGVGYVVIAPRETEDVLRKECEKKGITVFELGVVKTGEKQVVLQSHGFTFESD